MIPGLRNIKKTYGYLCDPTDFAREYLYYCSGMGYIVNSPTFRCDRDYFPDYVVMYCASGKLHISQYGRDAVLSPGQCCLMYLEDAHLYYSDPDEPCAVAWVHFGGENIRSLFQPVFRDAPGYLIIEDSRLLVLIQEIISSYESDSQNAFFKISADIYQILMLFLKASVSPCGPKSSLVRTLDPFLLRHIGEKITLEMMAEHCCLCPQYFCRRFRKETGMTPMQYLTKKRIELAKYYLLYTDEKISWIADTLGFYDANHFSLCLSQTAGTTPSKYRK